MSILRKWGVFGFARFYNKRHGRRGYFWGNRFKSVVGEKGETLINCLAYIDTRYFTDSGIIGGKAFVFETYQKVKTHFQSKRDKIPKPVAGLTGIYSLKRLTE